MMVSKSAIIPQISENSNIAFGEMINVEVQDNLKMIGRQFVPISILINRGATVVTGANMGGKSVVLKTLGLNVALAMLGWPVFAKSAVLPLIQNIHCIGTDNSTYKIGLSSFRKEMHDLIEAIKELESGTLLLIDGPARGTNPEEGSAIVKGVVKYLSESDAFSVVTTHYDGVSALVDCHYKVLGIRNTAVFQDTLNHTDKFDCSIFDRYMCYGLCEENTDSSVSREAIAVCRLLGMPQKIIDNIISSMI